VFSPSDLHAFLACPHLFALEYRRRQAGEPRPARNEEAEALARRGEAHEALQLQRFRDEGREIVEVGFPADGDWFRAAEATTEALRGGAPVVYQGVFLSGTWRGVADFLVRVPEPSALGDWSYEVWDTKLARRARSYFLLQLCFYSAQLASLQGRSPEWMRVVLGTGAVDPYRVDDFSAYSRHLWRRLETSAGALGDTYPYPVPHCKICDRHAECESTWERDDHVSLVASIRRDQVEQLEGAGIRTVAALGAAENPEVRIGARTLQQLRQQARLQHHQRSTGERRLELLPPESGRGFALLPAPDPGDLFFDMEGFPFFELAGGLEYLFGSVSIETGAPAFLGLRAASREEERIAFEAFVDLVTERVRAYPAAHVYHYAQYEPTALKRLAMHHGTHEADLDALLRRETFVDLFQVVRQSLRISEPSYSIKSVRKFFMPDAGHGEVTGGGESILAFERWLETGDPAIFDSIERYNEEDCVSTWRLRDWLLVRRTEAVAAYGEIPWRPVADRLEESPESATFGDVERDALLENAAGTSGPERDALITLAHTVIYHRREAKPEWWAYFARKTKSFDELLADTEAVAAIELDGEPRREKQSLIYPCRAEPQECKLTPDSQVEDLREDGPQVHIESLELAAGRLELRRHRNCEDEPLPTAIIAGGPVRTDAQRRALVELAQDVATNGLDHCRFGAARDILLRRPPRLANLAPGAPIQTTNLDRQKALVADLDRSYLFVQGPPGSGKTWTGARLIVSLLADGRRVGVTGPSHKAIHNVLDEVEKVAAAEGVEFRGLKKAGRSEESRYAGRCITWTADNKACEESDAQLLAGTSWLFAREKVRGALHTLFIDEAGQMALADALAVSMAAKNVVLLGDPQQLAHVAKGVHPAGSGLSVLAHLLEDRATVDAARGVFLERTWRMHDSICRFVSTMSYDGRLAAVPECNRQTIRASGALSGSGLRFLAVNHTGNAQRSDEEAARIGIEVNALLHEGVFTDMEGVVRPITPADILIVAPFNMHVQCIRGHVPAGVDVGTVDKFQGREAPVVFFAMGSSSGEDVPRGMGFLFSRNRLNVAISRARALAVIVASPALLGANCGQIEEMRLVNLLCRFAEEAGAC
jgi:predicted RecB family nuclease